MPRAWATGGYGTALTTREILGCISLIFSLGTVEHRFITTVPSATGSPGNYSRHTAGVSPMTKTSTDRTISSFSQMVICEGPNSSSKLAAFTSFLALIFKGNLTIGAPLYLQIPLTIALFIVPIPRKPMLGFF